MRLLSVKQVAEMLGLSQDAVRRRIATGVLPAYRLSADGRKPQNARLRVSEESLQGYLDACSDQRSIRTQRAKTVAMEREIAAARATLMAPRVRRDA